MAITSLALLSPYIAAASDSTSKWIEDGTSGDPDTSYALSTSYPKGIAARVQDDISRRLAFITVLVGLNFFVFVIYSAEFVTAYMHDRNERARYLSIFFNFRTLRLRIPTILWGLMSIVVLCLAGSFWGSVTADTCTPSPVDADVAGIGVRVSIWVCGGGSHIDGPSRPFSR